MTNEYVPSDELIALGVNALVNAGEPLDVFPGEYDNAAKLVLRAAVASGELIPKDRLELVSKRCMIDHDHKLSDTWLGGKAKCKLEDVYRLVADAPSVSAKAVLRHLRDNSGGFPITNDLVETLTGIPESEYSE